VVQKWVRPKKRRLYHLKLNTLFTAAHCCLFSPRFRDETLDPSKMTFAVGAHYDETCSIAGRCNQYDGNDTDITGQIVNAKMPFFRTNRIAIRKNLL